MAEDYERYKRRRNVTFIGINMSPVATLKTMEQQTGEFGLKPFAHMLDAGGATAAAYKVQRDKVLWTVVLDAEGKMSYSSGTLWTWSGDGGYVHHTQIEKSLEKSPGILGISDVPPDMAEVAHLYDLQQFALLDPALKKAESRGSVGGKDFTGQVRKKIDEQRQARAAAIQDLAQGRPLEAYREATAFLGAFPVCPEKDAITKLSRDLAKDAGVKKELDAESAYQRILVPELKKAAVKSMFDKKIPPLLESYLKTYGKTEFAATVKAAVEGHRKGLSD